MVARIGIIVFLLFQFIWSINAFSQEGSIYENNYLNPFIINAGATGAEYYSVGDFSIKKQWLGISESPSTFLLSGNSRLGKYGFYDPKGFINKGPLKLVDRIGLGAALYRDNNGPLSNTGMLLSYSYRVPINARSNLTFGLSGIGTIYSLNSSLLKPDQLNDPYLLTGNENIFRANVNIGIYYYSTDYFAGLSANKILPDISNVNVSSRELPSYFLIGGYKFLKSNKSFMLEPSFSLKKLAKKIYPLIFTQNCMWRDLIGLPYRIVPNRELIFNSLFIYIRWYI